MAFRRRAIVLVALGVIVSGVLTAALIISVTRSDVDPAVLTTTLSSTAPLADPADPRPIAQAFLTAWIHSDWSSIDALSTDLSASGQHSRWMSDLEVTDLELLLGEITERSGGRATAPVNVAVNVAGQGIWTYETQMVLIWDGASWLVDWFPGILHEELTSGDRLTIVWRWPERAPILDVDGRVIATTMPVISAGVIPNRVESRADVREAFATFTDVDPAKVDSVMDAPNVQPDWFLPIAEITREDYPDVRPGLYPVPGIAFRISEGRASVDEGLAQHIIGTTSAITAELLEELGEPYREGNLVGRTPSSLERLYELALAGYPSLDVVKVGSDGLEEVLHTFPGRPSEALSTTLSLDVQRAAEVALDDVETPAALVAIDVATGDIRAAVSRPLNGFNRAISGLYPPGSTFKLVVALAALESGYTPTSDLDCPAEIQVGEQTFGNATKLPSSMNLSEALLRSCNTAFIQLGASLDQSFIQEAARKLGFNLDYTIGLGTPSASYPTPESDPEAAAASIGQANVLVTPLHMASVAAALAGDGWRSPTLLPREPLAPHVAIDPAITETMQALMVEVVEDSKGTGKRARVEDRIVGGKTGTAQLGSAIDDPLVAWFVGFSEGIAFAVMVEEAESGGRTAAPVAASFLELLDRAGNDGEKDGCRDASKGWLTFQGSNSRVGCATGVPSISNPEVLWETQIGVQAWLNNPVISNDLVVVGTAGAVRNQSDSSDGVVAVRRSNGEVVWRVDTLRDVNGVAISRQRVVVTGDEGKVWGLRVSDGKIEWTFEAGTSVYTNPLVTDGLVVVGDAAGILWGIDLDDGTVVWRKFLLGAIRGGAATDGRLIYAATDRGDTIAVNRGGDTIWSGAIPSSTNSDSETSVLAAPTVLEDLVIFSIIEDGFDGPALVALDKYVGTERWRGIDKIGTAWSKLRNSSAVVGRDLVFASDLTKGLQAVDVASGVAVWEASASALCDQQWASPVVVGETVIIPSSDGWLYAIDADTRRTLWELELTVNEGPARDGPFCSRDEATVDSVGLQATPAVAPDGTIVVGSLGGWLYAVSEAG